MPSFEDTKQVDLSLNHRRNTRENIANTAATAMVKTIFTIFRADWVAVTRRPLGLIQALHRRGITHKNKNLGFVEMYQKVTMLYSLVVIYQ